MPGRMEGQLPPLPLVTGEAECSLAGLSLPSMGGRRPMSAGWHLTVFSALPDFALGQESATLPLPGPGRGPGTQSTGLGTKGKVACKRHVG